MLSINESISGLATSAKYAISNSVSAVQNGINNATGAVSKLLTTPLFGPKLAGLSMPSTTAPASAVFKGDKVDTRVKLIIPEYYFMGMTRGPQGKIADNKGIIFPYSPSINQEHSANWSETSVTHSNFKQYSYKNSSAGSISLTAEFTVQNEDDAWMYLAAVHLLRILTKMHWGDDGDAGAPPPVCRLMAYGDQMFNNIPVVVQSVRIELPNKVDFFDTGTEIFQQYGTSSVPVLSSINLTLLPVFSRDEQLSFGLDVWRFNRENEIGYI